MPRERVLTLGELNRALLARQLLLHRARISVPRAIERVGALQAQWPPAPYLALWSRLDGFSVEQLVRAIEQRRVVKATLMRTTLHHVSARDYLAYAGVFLTDREAWAERQLQGFAGDTDFERLASEVVRHATDQPRSRPELLELLGQSKLVLDDRRPWLVWYLLASRAGLVHGPPSSAWRHSTAGGTFVPARSWLGAVGASGAGAVGHLVGRYLSAFGPATRADMAQWTGLSIASLQPGVERLSLRRFRDELGRELLDLPRRPLPPAEMEAPVRFLPMFDSVLLAHEDRSRVLPDAYRKTVIRRGDVQRTFLVDGFVAGTWGLDDGQVQLEPFEPLGRDVRQALEREAKELARFYAAAPARRATQ